MNPIAFHLIKISFLLNLSLLNIWSLNFWSINLSGALAYETKNSKSSTTSDSYAEDDAHNHDGSHEEGPENCGTNYMLPGSIARLGSHSFIILGQDGPNHILADHRSGTPPHNYHYILRVKLDPDEMAFYKKLLSESKLTPAFTTIYFDDKDSKKQLDRTFFCLSDLSKIFGDQQKKKDQFEKIFPIRASLQKNADFEGAFEIGPSIYPGGHFTFDRSDIELLVYRYLPSYLEQSAFRTAIKEQKDQLLPLLSHAPSHATEDIKTAAQRTSYAHTDGSIAQTNEFCPSDYYLKKTNVPKTIHNFLLLTEIDKNTVLAVHYYDQSPHNYQTALKIKLSDEEMTVFRKAKKESNTPPLLQTRVQLKDQIENYYFCLAEIKTLAKDKNFNFKGTVYKNSTLNIYKLGSQIGTVSIDGQDLEIITNRNLLSLMNPIKVADDVLKRSTAANADEPLIDIKSINPSIEVEMRYLTDWNFLGRSVVGYQANKCLLTKEAAFALDKVQQEAGRLGLSLLVFDCYRPQKSVTEFALWAQDFKDEKMKSIFYPDEPKNKLFERGYIAKSSGHSRGSTIDLTLIKNLKTSTSSLLKFKESKLIDCRDTKNIEATNQLDMGTSFDCFSTLSNTANPNISKLAAENRSVLKSMMEKFGFVNYSKEWWHYTLKNEPSKNQYYDFDIR